MQRHLTMKKLTAQYIKKQLSAFFAARPYIAFGYLFGSRANNKFTPLSDIDIAVFIHREQAPENLFELRLKELTALFQLLKTEHIDLVFLNEAPVELSYKILQHGKLINERNPQQHTNFIENIVRKYLDWKPFIAERNKIIRQKMVEGTYFD